MLGLTERRMPAGEAALEVLDEVQSGNLAEKRWAGFRFRDRRCGEAAVCDAGWACHAVAKRCPCRETGFAEQVDPDSQSNRSVRRWAPERDLTGARLGLRLTTDGSVEPLTVREPQRLIVLGKVIDFARPTDAQLMRTLR